MTNIFDAAAGRDRKKKPEEKQAVVQTPSQAPAPEVRSGEESLEAQFARCKQYSEEIKKRIDNIYEEMKVSPREVKKYLETPQKFSDSQWKKIEKTKKEFEDKLAALIKKQPPPPEPPPKAASSDDKPKPPRPKSGFTSKKTWIPIR